MSHISILHNSYLDFFRSSFGAVPCNRSLTLRLKINTYAHLGVVLLKFKKDGGQQQELSMQLTEDRGEEKIYEANIITPSEPCLVWYYFLVISEGKNYYYGNNAHRYGGEGEIDEAIPPSYQITVYRENTTTPSWFKDAIMYQIFVDRFCNGCEDEKILSPKKNALLHLNWRDEPVYIFDKKGDISRWSFFGGNLLGVRKKLAYLKSLGVSVIYFNPVFEAPSNHKYDTGDYHAIDPMFGDNELFEKLCAEAKKLGISVILDGVFSHTGSDSIYFNKEGHYDSLGAWQSTGSPYYKWYTFMSCNEYECWWQIDTLPNVNEMEASYQDFIIFNENSVLKYWLGKGTKGWRLDVVDELPGQFIKNFKKTMREVDVEAVLIGEVWEDASNKESYGARREYLLGDEVDSVMNYPFRNIVLDFINGYKDGGETAWALMNLFENYPLHHFYSTMNLIGSHDVARALTLIKDGLPADIIEEKKTELGCARLKLAALWQMSFPGVPCIYYGDEAGLQGHDDPFNRKTYPWGYENKDLLNFYKKITALRKHYDVLKTGQWIPLDAKGEIFGYVRSIENGCDVFEQKRADNVAIILLNRSINQEIRLSLDVKRWCSSNIVDVLENYREIEITNGTLDVSLKPLEGKILLKDRWGSSSVNNRKCGVLLHPTSLPSRYGIGDLGREAYQFVDFLAKGEQRLWQILPLNPPGYGESPYQCLSAFAGNALLIDLGQLNREGLLEQGDLSNAPIFQEAAVDFAKARDFKNTLLWKAYQAFKSVSNDRTYENFLEKQSGWLEDYALFAALKKYFGGAAWNKWEKPILEREEEALNYYKSILHEEIEYHKFMQYKFFEQWEKLKEYAGSKGIKIIGDIPIFVAHDSSDVWVSPQLFELDEAGNPAKVAGVPPDYFSETGQRWGNPLYRWPEMEQDDYAWWRERFRTLLELVDIIRIDHFRGFEQYWEIPAGQKTAEYGKWVKGPNDKFFETMRSYLGELPVIAEDLGFITPGVHDLRIKFNFPGMKILQFEMEAGELDLPLNEKHTTLYTGSHDNDTIVGWYKKNSSLKIAELESEEDIAWHFIEKVYQSDAETVIIPLQDMLCLDSQARMNTPGTTEGNWRWRFSKDALNDLVAERLKNLVHTYKR